MNNKDKKPLNLGIVIPTYNESENIVPIIQSVVHYLGTIPEFAIVDDSDGLETINAIKEAELGDSITIIRRGRKLGRGSAVLEGIRVLLSKECSPIVEMDADFSHSPEELPKHLEYVQKNKTDLLIASRYLPDSTIIDWPLTRIIFSKCANTLASIVLAFRVRDYTNGYRVYSRRAAKLAVETCGSVGGGFISLSEILVQNHFAGHKIEEQPSIFLNRVRGKSAFSFKEVRDALTGIVKVYFLKEKIDESSGCANKENV